MMISKYDKRIPYNCIDPWGLHQSLKKTPRVERFDEETETNCVFKRSKVEGCTIPKIINMSRSTGDIMFITRNIRFIYHVTGATG